MGLLGSQNHDTTRPVSLTCFAHRSELANCLTWRQIHHKCRLEKALCLQVQPRCASPDTPANTPSPTVRVDAPYMLPQTCPLTIIHLRNHLRRGGRLCISDRMVLWIPLLHGSPQLAFCHRDCRRCFSRQTLVGCSGAGCPHIL